jgi:hypothetical protein
LSSCSGIREKEFIERKTLITNGEETVVYNVYQTGIDNYDFSFYSAYKGDTSEMFTYYLNDAVYTALRLEANIKTDTLVIETNMPTEEQRGITLAGTNYYLRQKK